MLCNRQLNGGKVFYIMPIKYKYNCYISFLKSPLNQNSLKYDSGGVKTTVIVIKSSFYKKPTKSIVDATLTVTLIYKKVIIIKTVKIEYLV